MDGVRQLFQARNISVVADGEEMPGGAGRVHTGNFHNVQAAAAPDACHMISNQPVGDIAVVAGKLCAHGRQNDPVGQMQIADLQRGEYFFKHSASSFVFVKGLFYVYTG